MNREIAEYLNRAEPDFESGFALFCKYSRNRIAMDWISRRHDMPKLLYELGKLRGTTVSAADTALSDLTLFTSRPQAPKAAAPRTEDPPQERRVVFRTYDDRRTRRSDLPEDLQRVYDGIADDYKLRRRAHELMKYAGSSYDRMVFRDQVIETNARIMEGWQRIDAWLERHEAERMNETFNERTCRSYISKCLNRERNSEAQLRTCRARLKALQDHGCELSESLKARLEELFTANNM